MDHPYQLIVKVRQRPFTAQDASPNSGVPHMAMQNWELLIARAMLNQANERIEQKLKDR
jgi:hypothetical protein